MKVLKSVKVLLTSWAYPAITATYSWVSYSVLFFNLTFPFPGHAVCHLKQHRNLKTFQWSKIYVIPNSKQAKKSLVHNSTYSYSITSPNLPSMQGIVSNEKQRKQKFVQSLSIALSSDSPYLGLWPRWWRSSLTPALRSMVAHAPQPSAMLEMPMAIPSHNSHAHVHSGVLGITGVWSGPKWRNAKSDLSPYS